MIAFLIACLLLLLSPGPTNMLMAVAGALGGLRRVRALLLAEVVGYLTAILPLLAFGDIVDRRWPAVAFALKLVMAGWVLFLAAKLWAVPAVRGDKNDVTARKVYVTTMLNPKAAVFALVLLPGGGSGELMPRLAGLMLLIIGAALAWGSGGHALCSGDGNAQRQLVVRRVASVWLATISAVLMIQVARV